MTERPAPSRGKAVLVVMMDIDPSLEDEFNRWLNEEHVPERLSITGFISARRFRAVDGTPKYLALYELESADVFTSAEYLHRVNDTPTEWTRRMRQHYKIFARNVFVEIFHQDAER